MKTENDYLFHKFLVIKFLFFDQLSRLEELLAEHNIEVGEKEKARLHKMADEHGRIAR
jgi:hypothetical protein